MSSAPKRKGGAEKLREKKNNTCDALSGQRAVYWVGRFDGNSRATFFPQSVAGDPERRKGGYKRKRWRQEGGGGKISKTNHPDLAIDEV